MATVPGYRALIEAFEHDRALSTRPPGGDLAFADEQETT